MQPLFDLLGKFLGAQWLWNLATLALLLQAYKAFSKLQKLPDDALSKADFQVYKDAVDARFKTVESPLASAVARVHTLWRRAGISDPRVPRADAEGRGSDPVDRTYSENVEIVEKDPWPRRRATDRLLTPRSGAALDPRDPRDEARYGRTREDYGDRGSDPDRRRSPPIPREEPQGPPSDRPFESDPRDRSSFNGEPFDGEPSVPPRPKRR